MAGEGVGRHFGICISKILEVDRCIFPKNGHFFEIFEMHLPTTPQKSLFIAFLLTNFPKISKKVLKNFQDAKGKFLLEVLPLHGERTLEDLKQLSRSWESYIHWCCHLSNLARSDYCSFTVWARPLLCPSTVQSWSGYCPAILEERYELGPARSRCSRSMVRLRSELDPRSF